jgi:hypothetical protein
MEQDEVALVKAIESGDTDLGTSNLDKSNISFHCIATSSMETSVGSILQSDQRQASGIAII